MTFGPFVGQWLTRMRQKRAFLLHSWSGKIKNVVSSGCVRSCVCIYLFFFLYLFLFRFTYFADNLIFRVSFESGRRESILESRRKQTCPTIIRFSRHLHGLNAQASKFEGEIVLVFYFFAAKLLTIFFAVQWDSIFGGANSRFRSQEDVSARYFGKAARGSAGRGRVYGLFSNVKG